MIDSFLVRSTVASVLLAVASPRAYACDSPERGADRYDPDHSRGPDVHVRGDGRLHDAAVLGAERRGAENASAGPGRGDRPTSILGPADGRGARDAPRARVHHVRVAGHRASRRPGHGHQSRHHQPDRRRRRRVDCERAGDAGDCDFDHRAESRRAPDVPANADRRQLRRHRSTTSCSPEPDVTVACVRARTRSSATRIASGDVDSDGTADVLLASSPTPDQPTVAIYVAYGPMVERCRCRPTSSCSRRSPARHALRRQHRGRRRRTGDGVDDVLSGFIGEAQPVPRDRSTRRRQVRPERTPSSRVRRRFSQAGDDVDIAHDHGRRRAGRHRHREPRRVHPASTGRVYVFSGTTSGNRVRGSERDVHVRRCGPRATNGQRRPSRSAMRPGDGIGDLAHRRTSRHPRRRPLPGRGRRTGWHLRPRERGLRDRCSPSRTTNAIGIGSGRRRPGRGRNATTSLVGYRPGPTYRAART